MVVLYTLKSIFCNFIFLFRSTLCDIMFRLVVKLFCNQHATLPRTNARFNFHRLLYEVGSNTSDKTTPILLDRFFEFFRNNEKYGLYTVHDTDMDMSLMRNIGDKCLVEQLNNVAMPQIPSFLLSLSFQSHTFPKRSFQYLLSSADKVYSEKMHQMDKNCVLKCVYAWYYLCNGNIIHSAIYSRFIFLVHLWLNEEDCCIEHLVYIMFYSAFSKKTSASQYILKQCLNGIDAHINFLSLEEICIIIISSYKCSVRIKSASLLQYICFIMDKHLKRLMTDPGLLVTFSKGLRLAKHYDFKIMEKIASKLYCSNVIKLNFTAKIHLLALYADARYDKNPFIRSLIHSCLKDTNSSALQANDYTGLRMKDISRLLWATSYLGYNPPLDELKHIIQELQRCVNECHHLQIPEHIVSSLLSLWIIGHHEHLLFKSAISEDFMQSLKKKNLFRGSSRLSLLLTCIQIEMPEILSKMHFHWEVSNKIPEEALKKHMKKRNFLKQTYTAITHLSKHKKLHASSGCQIPNLNILGLTISSDTGKTLHVEVMDETVCLHNTHVPHGLMKLKLRLLKHLGHHVCVVKDNQFDFEKDSSGMYIFLEEEIMKLLKFT